MRCAMASMLRSNGSMAQRKSSFTLFPSLRVARSRHATPVHRPGSDEKSRVSFAQPPDSNLWATLNSQEGDTSYNISVNVAPHSYCSNITTDMSCGETNFTVGLWTPGKCMWFLLFSIPAMSELTLDGFEWMQTRSLWQAWLTPAPSVTLT